jgi:hypothetical protein
MLDYARDTYIVDLGDIDDAPRAPRATTEELTMHVNVLGIWHRRTPDLGATACGILYHSQYSPTRREDLTGDLCADCFTGYELALASSNNRKGIEP